tara:strand:- start:5757 stop:11744 length:5988 start_codon:yes stop_codon:yes gene_type:complete
MADNDKDKMSLISLSEEIEIFPDDPNYPFPEGVKSAQEKADYWYEQFVEDFDAYPKCPSRPKLNWNPHNSVGSSTWKERWLVSAKKRIRNFKSSDTTKSGFKVFRKITGWYQIHINDADTNLKQGKRLKQIIKLIQDSEYGSIDPLTGKEAIVDLESQTEGITYFFQDLSTPSNLCYSVMEAEVAPLLLTETLLESNLRGQIYKQYKEQGRIPSLKSVFPIIMQMGKTSQMFLAMREDIPALRASISSIIGEMEAEEGETLDEVVNNFIAETPEYGAVGELKSVTKTIPLKTFLALKFENATIKNTLQQMRPPVDGMKRGKDWPKNDTQDWIMHITQDPQEVMQKSTNSHWPSCESLDNSYARKGCWDDFGHGNAIALYYRASDMLDDEGNLVIDRSKKQGRTMLRWAMTRESSWPQQEARIGSEARTYGGINSNVIKQLSSALITIMQNAGLWDWKQSLLTPYTYKGYADRTGSRGGRIEYPKAALSNLTAGGMEMADAQQAALQLTYNTQIELSFGELTGIMDMNDSDEVLLNLADNPVCWNYHRIIGRFVRNIFGMYNDDSREILLKLLLSHEYANPSLLIPALESMDVIDPNFRQLANPDDVIFAFARHPRSGTEVHEMINTLMGDDAKNLYALPSPPNLTELDGPQYESLIYADADIWQPYVDKLSEIAITEELIEDGTDKDIKDTFADFGEWYGSVLTRWAGLYDSAPSIVERYNESGLGAGIWGASLLTYKLLNQPKISQEQYNTLLAIFFRINTLLETDIIVGRDENISPLPANRCPQDEMLNGVLNLLTLNFNKTDYQGWDLYGGVNPIPIYVKNKNYVPRTHETTIIALGFLYQKLLRSGWDNPDVELNKVAETIFTLYGGCRSSSDVEAFYNFVIGKITYKNTVLTKRIGENNVMKLQAMIIPMFFLSAFKRKNREKKGLTLLPISAIPAIFSLLTNNSYGESYYNSVFYQFVPYGKYGEFLNCLHGFDESKIGLIGARKQKVLSAELAFNILANDEIFEGINLKDLAHQLPDNEDLFYIMEDVILSHYLQELYDPEGERPFADLTIEQLRPNSEEQFELSLITENGLPKIAEMIYGFVSNPHTPSEIIERIIQKPRIESGGYRRMFEYYTLGNNPLEMNEETFKKRIIEPLIQDYKPEGRLLKYLYANYPSERKHFVDNPNIVEARIFDELCDEFPLLMLGSHDITKRAYLRHLRKTLKELKLSPQHKINPTFTRWIEEMRGVLSNTHSNILSVAQRWVNLANSNESIQFIRAGRCRFGTSLPTAIEGPNNRNLSRAGSIPDYPQIPADDKPFAIFRAINVNPFELKELTGLDNIYDGITTLPTVSDIFSAILNCMAVGQINPMNLVRCVDEEGEELDESRTIEGRIPAGNSLFLNTDYSQESVKSDLMMVFKSQYIVDDTDMFAELGNYSQANLQGLNIGNCTSMTNIRPPLDIMQGVIGNETLRRGIMEFIRLCPDGLDIRQLRMRNLVAANDGDGSALENYFNKVAVGFIEPNTIYNWPEDVIREMGENTLIIDAINEISGNSRDLLSIIKDAKNIQEIPIAIMTYLLKNIFIGNQPTLTKTAEGQFSATPPNDFKIKIMNGIYNLESIFGWIPPENRVKLTNYDSKGRFNDRLSAFLPDWIMVCTLDGLPPFTSPINEEELAVVPSWRLGFNLDEFRLMWSDVQESYKVGQINLSDYLEMVELMLLSIDDRDCTLFPTRDGGNDRYYGLGGLTHFTSMGWQLLLQMEYLAPPPNEASPMKYFDVNCMILYELAREEIFRANNEGRTSQNIINFSTGGYDPNAFGDAWVEIMWGDKPSWEHRNELIHLLISLDNNEQGTIGQEGHEITEESLREYQKEKWNNLKSFLKTHMKSGLKLWNQFRQVETKNHYWTSQHTLSQHDFPRNINNDATYKSIAKILFEFMVEGYMEYLNNNKKNLTWKDFSLMVRLLSFDAPSDTQVRITPNQITALQTIRDESICLPLFMQALRATTIREDEEFIE